jgi:hypothetical protein
MPSISRSYTTRRRGPALQLAAALLPLAVLAPSAQAAPANGWYASIGAIYTDNILKSSTDKRSNLAPEAGLGGVYVGDRERLKTDLEADLSYAAYPTGLYFAGQPTPQTLNGAASLSLTGLIVPDRLLWLVKDNYGTAPVNLANPDTPYNRQRTNVVETGPKALIPLGSRNELQLAASWFSSSFGATDADGRGEKASVALVRRTSLSGTLSAEVSGTRIEYPTAQSASDFDVRSALLRWHRVRQRGDFILELGTTEIHAQGADQHSPLARVTFTRQITTHSRFALAGGREFSSSAMAFQDNQTFFGVTRSLNDVQATADPFRSDFGRLSWLVSGERLEVVAQANLRHDVYESDPLLNLRAYGFETSISRALSSRVRVGMRGDYERRQFERLVVTSFDRRFGVDAVYSFSPSLQLTLSADRYSGTNQGTLSAFVENTEQLRLSYRSYAK